MTNYTKSSYHLLFLFKKIFLNKARVEVLVCGPVWNKVNI